jgi:hypothetical protein
MGNNFASKALFDFQSMRGESEYIYTNIEPLQLGDIVYLSVKRKTLAIEKTACNITSVPANTNRPSPPANVCPSLSQIFCYEKGAVAGLGIECNITGACDLNINLTFDQQAALCFQLFDDAKLSYLQLFDTISWLKPYWNYVKTLQDGIQKELYIVVGIYAGSGFLAYKRKSSRKSVLRAVFPCNATIRSEQYCPNMTMIKLIFRSDL